MLSWMAFAALGLAIPPLLPAVVDARWPLWVAVACGLCWRWRPMPKLILLLLALAYSAHYCAQRAAQLPPEALAYVDVEFDALLLGPVERRSTERGAYYRFDVQLSRGQCAANYCPPGRPTFRLNYYAGEPPPVGRWLRLRLRLRPPDGSQSEGAFDYARWLVAGGYAGSGYVREVLAPLDREPGLLGRYQQWRNSLLQWARRDLAVYPQQALMRALLVADRRSMTTAQWQLFSMTGTSHLMAISGMHIAIVVAWGFAVARLLAVFGRGGRHSLLIGPLLALAGALLYSAMAGFTLPTQRALIMASVFCIAILARRRISAWQGWQFALLLVLWRDPMAVHSAGFYLSFAAVAALLLIAMENSPPRWRGLRLLRMQALLLLALLPVLALWGFGQGLAALPANLLAIPLMALLVMPLLFTALFFAVLWPPLSAIIFTFADTALSSLLRYLGVLAEWPFWQPPSTGMAWFALLLAALLWLLPRGIPGRPLAALFLVVAALQPSAKPDPGSFWLSVIDVGQGLSVLLQHADRALLFDVGPDFDSGYNTADAIVMPLLRRRGITHIDWLVLSHGDRDHAGAAAALLEGVSVGRVFSGDPARHQQWRAENCHNSAPWRWGEISLAFIDHGGSSAASSNNRSCVLLIRLGEYSVLLPGDIEAQAEQRLLTQWRPERPVDLLVAAHHGSNSSSSPQFVTAAAPTDVVFSASRFNRYRHPSAEVLQRYAQLASRCWQTGRHGSLHFVIDSRGVRPLHQGGRRGYFWQHRPTEMCAAADSLAQ